MRSSLNAAERAPYFGKPQEKISQYTHVYLAPTPSCGTGMFTARPVTAGSIALFVFDRSYMAQRKPYAQLMREGYTISDIFQVDHDLFIPPYGGLDDFTNHSCDPSCGLRVHSAGFDMIALRDLAAGDELTYDYSTHQEHPEGEIICLCGAASCRGVVRSFSTLPPALRRRYLDLGVVARFIANNAGRASSRC